MVENEKKHGFMDIIKDGLGYVSQIILASMVPPITQGAEVIMKKIDDRMILLENRVLKKISSLIILGFGAVFLIIALLFFLTEYLHWTNAVSFFSIGITIFVIGLILKLMESGK